MLACPGRDVSLAEWYLKLSTPQYDLFHEAILKLSSLFHHFLVAAYHHINHAHTGLIIRIDDTPASPASILDIATPVPAKTPPLFE
jgi:hypothetical protein